MRRRRDLLDEYVRQATRDNEERAAALEDPAAKDALFEEIVSMQIAGPSVSPRPPRHGHRRAWAVAAGVAVIVAAAIAVTVQLGSRDRPPVTAPIVQHSAQGSPAGHQGDVFGSGGALSCVEEYSPDTLAKRGFAFDGTVVSVGKPSSTGDGADPYVPVVFNVNHWFKGGQGARVTVAMFPPGVVTSAGTAVYGIGSRLLVSGESRSGGDPLQDPIAWACGFTRWRTDADADAWQQTFR